MRTAGDHSGEPVLLECGLVHRWLGERIQGLSRDRLRRILMVALFAWATTAKSAFGWYLASEIDR
jgi:hypothetical protein